MPRKIFTSIQLPPEQPDCCYNCPLCGIIPKNKIPKGSKQTFVCLASCEAMSERKTKIRKSTHDPKHPYKRFCDSKWAIWKDRLNSKYNVRIVDYTTYLIPKLERQEMVIKFR